MDLQLHGKTAIVTGGSRGIGKAIALELATEGVNVAIVARNRDLLDQTALELSKLTNQTIIPIVADTRHDDSVQQMVRSAAGALGSIDILVNSAAKPAGGGRCLNCGISLTNCSGTI